MRKLSKIDESVWADMHKRSNTGAIRKEDKWFEEKVMKFIEKHNLKESDYSINSSDLSVDIKCNIVIKPGDLVDGKLPFKFGRIDGTMWLNDLRIKTLENSPKEVYGNFVIYDNELENFIGGPELVTGDFAANLNRHLKSLDGSPKKVGKNYSIRYCLNVKNIDGISPEIGGNLEITSSNKPGMWCDFSDEEFRKLSDIKGQITRI